MTARRTIHWIVVLLLIGSALLSTTPPTTTAQTPDDPTFTALAAGWDHTCALTDAGAVRCWGCNEYGQLGDGTSGDGDYTTLDAFSTTPTPVSGLASGVTALAAGGYHTCALTDAGAVRCWGRNYYGQLGDGTSGLGNISTTPTPVVFSEPADPPPVELSDEDAIRAAVRAHVGDAGFEYTVSDICIDQGFATARVAPVEEGQADATSAILEKVDGQWTVIHSGPGIPTVDFFERLGLPLDFACLTPIDAPPPDAPPPDAPPPDDPGTPGLRLTESNGDTAVVEGDRDSYEIVLTGAPSANVTIALGTDGTVQLNPSELVFTPTTWDTPQTVTVAVADDDIPTGNRTGTIVHTISTTDSDYAARSIPAVTVQITDDDVGLSFTESGDTTQVVEGGNADSYAVVLSTQPSTEVTLNLQHTPQVRVTPPELTFTPTTWDTPQSVTVSAVDDGVVEGNQSTTITHTVTSDDPFYTRLEPALIPVTIREPQVSDIMVFEPGERTLVAEGSTPDTYEVSLAVAPAAAVTLAIATDGATTVSPSTLTFTPATWETPQRVTVSAVDTPTAEGTRQSLVTHTSSSSDPAYAGEVSSFLVTVVDNDSPGVLIQESASATTVGEGEPRDSYAVALTYPPNDLVTIALTTDGQTSVEPAVLIFTPETWSAPRTVRVTGVADGIPEAPHTSTIYHTVQSSDSGYQDLAVSGVTVAISDHTYTIPQEQEPNDNTTPTERNPIGPREAEPTASWSYSITGSLDRADDSDWFTFQVQQPDSIVSVLLSDLPADYDLLLGQVQPPPAPGATGFERGLSTIVSLGRTRTRARRHRMRARRHRMRARRHRMRARRHRMRSNSRGRRARSSGRLPEMHARAQMHGDMILAVSLEPGRNDEIIEATLWEPGEYFLAVVNANGEYTTQHYLLDVEVYGSGLAALEDPPAITLNPAQVSPDETVQTLFLLNSRRMQQQYPGSSTDLTTLRQELENLAAHPQVQGVVLDLEEVVPALEDLYTEWDADPGNTFTANRVAQTIDNLIAAATVTNGGGDPPLPNVTSVVLVGGDSIIPFYRVPDQTLFANEAEYNSELAAAGIINSRSALSGALRYGTLLTDDIYGNDQPYVRAAHPFYVPDRAVGRLVEEPAAILAYVQQYTTGGAPLEIDATTAYSSALVTGYDFMNDQTEEVAEVMDDLGLSVEYLTGDTPPWSADDLTATWFEGQFDQIANASAGITSTMPLQSINAHFTHAAAIPAAADANPGQPTLLAASLLPTTLGNGTPRFFTNRLGYSIGCHSGLNVTPEDILASADAHYQGDFPQAFLAQGGTWIGNTGYGYGDYDFVGYSERLAVLLTKELGRDIRADDDDDTYSGQPVGTGLVWAKQRYVNNATSLDDYDLKVLMQTTLYGFPFLRVKVPEPLPLPPEATAVVVADQPPANDLGIVERVITMTATVDPRVPVERTGATYPALQELTVTGDSFIPAGEPLPTPRIIEASQEGLPLLPQGAYDLQALNHAQTEPLVVKDVQLVSGDFETLTNYKPHITSVITRDVPVEMPDFTGGVGVWTPDLFYDHSSTGQGAEQRSQLLVTPAQYRGESEDGLQGTMRLMQQMVFRVFYVDPTAAQASQSLADTTPPVIRQVRAREQAARGAQVAQAGGSRVILEMQVADADQDATGLADNGIQALYRDGTGRWQAVTFTQVEGEQWQAHLDNADRARLDVLFLVRDAAGNMSYFSNKGSFAVPFVVPVERILIEGGTSGRTGTPLTLEAIVMPEDATQPVEYTWEPAPGEGQGGATPQYAFDQSDTYTLTVTATNEGNSSEVRSEEYVITVEPAHILYLPAIQTEQPAVSIEE